MSTEISTVPQERIVQHFRRLFDQNTDSYDLICFDFFDTLVSRTVRPEETKIAAAHQLAALVGDFVDGELIYRLRSGLEKKLCAQNKAAGKDLEFNLADLSEELFGILKHLVKTEIPGDASRFVEWVLDIELHVEKKVQYLNSHIADALMYCSELGIKTAVISDFYIPGDYFFRMIKNHGLDAYVDYLFVSSDVFQTKGNSGKLYERVIKETGSDPGRMIMVGDNYRADCEMAKTKGISSVWLGPNTHNEDTTSGVGASGIPVEKRYIDALEESGIDCFPEVGFSLFLFTHRLYEQSVRDGCDALFFCSKEGEFLKRLFEQYQEIRFGRQKITSHYLLVSRKSTYICSLETLENETFERLFCHYRNMSTSEFLKSLNFSDFEVDDICSELGLDQEISYENYCDRKEFQTLTESSCFRKRYSVHRELQRDNFRSYLNSFGSDYEKNGLSIVDVGWKGSIQNNIYLALDGKVAVAGYYIGLLTPTELKENNLKKGLLFSDYPQHSDFIHVYNNNRSLFEMVLGASHGSADGYFIEEEFSAAKRHEMSRLAELPQQAGNGTGLPAPAILDLPEERELFNRIIKPLQQNYLKLNARLTGLLVSPDPVLPSAEWFARMHARPMFRPTKKEVDLFAGLYHLENFGVFGFTEFRSEKKIGIKEKIQNFLRLRKHPEMYLETGVWPPIILRRLGLEILIPVDGRRRYKRIFGKDK